MDQPNPSHPPRERRTSFEVVRVPAEHAPSTSWPLRVLLGTVAVALLGLAIGLATWKPPRVNDVLTWEQIAPPETIPMRAWRWIVIHHSATRGGDAQAFDTTHAQKRGWDGIGYHFVIGNGRPMPLGRIEGTFRWRNQTHGAHAGNEQLNQEGIGICLVGDFDQDRPDSFMEQRLVELCAMLLDRIPTLSIARVVGHRDVPGKHTDCPGRYLDVERIRFLIREEMSRRGMAVR